MHNEIEVMEPCVKGFCVEEFIKELSKQLGVPKRYIALKERIDPYIKIWHVRTVLRKEIDREMFEYLYQMYQDRLEEGDNQIDKTNHI